jgi:hypothetical protein|tara:strand:- start:15385 stop:15726 length:342 start_codon:yes stop_codon:yes gene_type:complete
MSAGTYNLVVDQGSDFAVDLAITEEGVAKNLTGYSGRAQIRSSHTASTISGSFVCTLVGAATEGVMKLSLTAATTSAMASGVYVYDLEIFTGSDAVVKRLIEGTVTLNPEVTR